MIFVTAEVEPSPQSLDSLHGPMDDHAPCFDHCTCDIPLHDDDDDDDDDDDYCFVIFVIVIVFIVILYYYHYYYCYYYLLLLFFYESQLVGVAELLFASAARIGGLGGGRGKTGPKP